MAPRFKYGMAAGVVLGLILLFVSPWLGLVVILLALAAPLIAWRMLDPAQRARIKRMDSRGQLRR